MSLPATPDNYDAPYVPAPDRYADAGFRRCGRSGLDLPLVSLGLWHNFGDDRTLTDQRAILTRAFDMGITQFDLANNYGVPYGSAEANFGRHMARDFRPYRDELVITSKAGWDMWPGPYGMGGSSRKYLLSSLDQSLKRMGLDYVDIFYSHRPDPTTPIEETIGALDQAVRSGKAIYAGISSYDEAWTREAVRLAREVHLPLVVHQPRYSLLDRWIEGGVMDACTELGLGLAVFSPLAQGLLTDRYLGGIPGDSRASRVSGVADQVTKERLGGIRELNAIAAARGQSLAQMAVAWLVSKPAVTTVLIGASSVAQLKDTAAAVQNYEFADDELARIDEISQRIKL